MSNRTLRNPDPAKAAEFVRQVMSAHGMTSADVGIILGSGLGGAAEHLLHCGGTSISYSAIPGMPGTHVTGHVGRLVLGRIDGLSIAFLQGRVHYYEGHDAPSILFGTQLLAQLGIHTLIVTNAAGGIRQSMQPGDLMLIQSHLRPLGTGFLDFSSLVDLPRDFATSESDQNLWNPALRQLAKKISTSLSIHEGVYAMMTGPGYETPAEIRMLQLFGADAVGMSTIPEAIYAASAGILVLGVSCITNVAAGLSDQVLSHAEVTATVSAVESEFVMWLWSLLQKMKDQTL